MRASASRCLDADRQLCRRPEEVGGDLLLLLTPFYTFLSYKYNANSIFLSIWPWTLLFLCPLLDRRRVSRLDSVWVCMGFAMMSKYYALILAATCFIAASSHPLRSEYFASASPYISRGHRRRYLRATCLVAVVERCAAGALPLSHLRTRVRRGPGVCGDSVFRLTGAKRRRLRRRGLHGARLRRANGWRRSAGNGRTRSFGC